MGSQVGGYSGIKVPTKVRIGEQSLEDKPGQGGSRSARKWSPEKPHQVKSVRRIDREQSYKQAEAGNWVIMPRAESRSKQDGVAEQICQNRGLFPFPILSSGLDAGSKGSADSNQSL